MGQFRPDVARVVIDLTGSAPYQIAHEGDAIVVYLQVATRRCKRTGSSDVHHFDNSKKECFRCRSLRQPNEASNAHISLCRTQLTQPSADFGGGEGNLAARRLRPTAHSRRRNRPCSRPPPRRRRLPRSRPRQRRTRPPAGRYTGEPISVNLKDVDLKDFFRLIHEISGLNVVLDPNVKGTLTIVLDEVPWDQALDIVLLNNGLDKQLNGNVLRVATRDTLKREAETARDLQKAQAEAVAPVTVTRVLSYAKAATMKDTLKKFLSAAAIFSPMTARTSW